MSDEEDYSSEDDLDYVPNAEDVSEEDGSGEEEDIGWMNDDSEEGGKASGKRKRKKKKEDQLVPRKRKGGIQLEGENGDDTKTQEDEEAESVSSAKLSEAIAEEKKAKAEESEKKKADDLWSSFLSDVPKPQRPVSSSSNKTSNVSPSPQVKPDTSKPVAAKKVTIIKEFDFVGETIKVTKEVDATSKEAQDEMKKQSAEAEKEKPTSSVSLEKPSVSVIKSVIPGVKKAPTGGAGLGGLLNKIGKKPKMSVLDKSKMDWNSFKQDEGIEDDLKVHNRGKESYLERMAFLNRSDVRQFEIEKSLRLGSSKR